MPTTNSTASGAVLTVVKDGTTAYDTESRGGTRRPDETSGTSASDGSTTEDDSEVQCNLETMNGQQRKVLRKIAEQPFMDEIDQLTTK